MTDDAMRERVRRALWPKTPEGSFDPATRWEDVGRLVDAMEASGYFLMVNSTSEPVLRRIAAFHRVTEQGFPCAGSSEWGPFPTLGTAILVAADEALYRPRQ